MTQYITIEKLEKYLKAMVILDIIMVAEKDAWLRLISAEKLDGGHGYVIDNGSGDSLTIYVTSNGAFIKGSDHENECNQFAADEWDAEFFKYIYGGVPVEFTNFLDEDAMDNTTFCMWCTDETDLWMQNEMDGNDGGKEFLLRYICQSAEDWCEWAKYYYEMDINMDIVQKVYDGVQLVEKDVTKLNPDRDANVALEEINAFLRA